MRHVISTGVCGKVQIGLAYIRLHACAVRVQNHCILFFKENRYNFREGNYTEIVLAPFQKGLLYPGSKSFPLRIESFSEGVYFYVIKVFFFLLDKIEENLVLLKHRTSRVVIKLLMCTIWSEPTQRVYVRKYVFTCRGSYITMIGTRYFVAYCRTWSPGKSVINSVPISREIL